MGVEREREGEPVRKEKNGEGRAKGVFFLVF